MNVPNFINSSKICKKKNKKNALISTDNLNSEMDKLRLQLICSHDKTCQYIQADLTAVLFLHLTSVSRLRYLPGI